MAQPQEGSGLIGEIALAGFVIMLIVILLVEMPNWVINFSISLNITLGVLLMMMANLFQIKNMIMQDHM